MSRLYLKHFMNIKYIYIYNTTEMNSCDKACKAERVYSWILFRKVWRPLLEAINLILTMYIFFFSVFNLFTMVLFISFCCCYLTLWLGLLFYRCVLLIMQFLTAPVFSAIFSFQIANLNSHCLCIQWSLLFLFFSLPFFGLLHACIVPVLVLSTLPMFNLKGSAQIFHLFMRSFPEPVKLPLLRYSLMPKCC